MLSKSLIQLSVDGRGYVPSIMFDLGPNYGGGNEDYGDLPQKAPCMRSQEYRATLSAPDPVAGYHQPTSPPETPGHHRQVWVSLWWRHCSFLLGSGAHKVFFVPSKSLFPQSFIKFCNQTPLLHSICQQIWKNQQESRDWKRSVFIPIPKKGNAKECSNYCTIALMSQPSKVILKILQARLQQFVNCELPDRCSSWF